MAVPKIVFCASNHIYDSAIHSECPYCLKIAEEQRLLLHGLVEEQGAVSGEEDNNNDDYTELINKQRHIQKLDEPYTEDDHTELIYHPGNAQDIIKENDHTELIYHSEKAHNVINEEDEEDDHTELIYHSRKVREPYVVGWLVCIMGFQKGRSLELVEGENYMYFQDEKLTLSSTRLVQGTEVGIICENKGNGKFSLYAKDRKCTVNNIAVRGEYFLKQYDSIIIQGTKYVFVRLTSEFFEWGL